MNLEWAANAEPVDLRWEDNDTRVGVTWNDGHVSTYTLPYLRRICPCAVCRSAHAKPPIHQSDGKSKFQILSDAQAKLANANAKVLESYPLGSYAIGLKWGDGHHEGIYSYTMLRALCPCTECSERLKANLDGQG